MISTSSGPGDPDWFFRISKFSIPWLQPSLGAEDVLSERVETPARADREQLAAEAAFSFAGGGIIFAPTDAADRGDSAGERKNYILQERVAFTPAIDTPDGTTQVEIRIMFVRDGDGYRRSSRSAAWAAAK